MAQSNLALKAAIRQEIGKKVENLRRQDLIPAVLYGHEVKNLNLAVSRRDFEKTFAQSGENTLVKLLVDEQAPRTVLIHDAQRHFMTDKFLHVDFYEVSMTEKIKAKVPLNFIGEAKAVKDLGGVLVKVMNEVEVESLPGDLPHAFDVDISKLNTFEDNIAVSDLKFDAEKVKLTPAITEIIAKVQPPRTEEELKSLEEKPVEEVAAVEGIEKKEEPAVPAEGEEPAAAAKAE